MHINQESSLCVTFLQDLIALNTVNPPGNESIAAEYIATALYKYGIECELMPVGEHRCNVITKALTQDPAIIFTGHLDVVPIGEGWKTDPFKASPSSGNIYGRGACDMKGGIAAMMAAAVWATRHSEGIHPFRLMFVADEEIYGLGTKALMKILSPQTTKYCIIGEPTGNTIHIAHRGAIRFKVRMLGRACHASAPQMGINAIESMMRVIEAVSAINEDFKQIHHATLPSPTMCCTMINAGTKDNIIPDLCEMVIDCRPIVGDTALSFEKTIRKKILALGGLNKGVQMELTPYINVMAGDVEEDSPIVQWAKDRFLQAFHKEATVNSFPACCDLTHFTTNGFPAILYGPGWIAQAHTANEFISMEQLKNAFTFYCACLAQGS
ncbi:MAG: M20 family metallopeptidase [Clostridia bacterium]